jgi:hypothetical protein
MTFRRVTRRKPLEAGLASPGPLFQWMENEKSKFELEGRKSRNGECRSE